MGVVHSQFGVVHCQQYVAFKNENLDEEDECVDFRREQLVKRRVHLYYLDYTFPSQTIESYDVTLVSQLSIDRLQMLEMLSRHWPGPMSIALYLSDTEVQRFLSFVTNSETLSNRKNIAFHIVYRDGVSNLTCHNFIIVACVSHGLFYCVIEVF